MGHFEWVPGKQGGLISSTHSLAHSLICSLAHLLTYSLAHLLTGSLYSTISCRAHYHSLASHARSSCLQLCVLSSFKCLVFSFYFCCLRFLSRQTTLAHAQIGQNTCKQQNSRDNTRVNTAVHVCPHFTPTSLLTHIEL